MFCIYVSSISLRDNHIQEMWELSHKTVSADKEQIKPENMLKIALQLFFFQL